MRFDTIIANGKIVDGTGGSAYIADLGIANGRIAAIGRLRDAEAGERIDASGKIVAPGHIANHAHYDVSLFWDPYCSNSGENGITTVANANCGFGIAPVKPSDRERTMLMMANTEQIPVSHQKAALDWNWTDFPSYLERVRALGKGINIVTFLPLNPLLIYVMGIEGAKSRRPTAAEYHQLEQLINEAMDAGAIGISMSVMGAAGNSHVDYDGSPMPTDALDHDVVIELARMLARRGEGVIQMLSQIVTFGDRSVTERVAEAVKGSGVRVLHNIFITTDAMPDLPAEDKAWLDSLRRKGLDVTAATLVDRSWVEADIQELDTVMGQLAAIRELVGIDREAVLKLLHDPAYGERLERDYGEMGEASGSAAIEYQTVLAIGDKPELQKFVGRSMTDIGEELGLSPVQALLHLGRESGLEIIVRTPLVSGTDVYKAVELISHPGIIAGGSDGGAHTKTFSKGQYGTDLLIWMVRETGALTIEEAHFQLSLKPSQTLNLRDRGALLPGFWADILIYDLDELFYEMDRLEIVYDMPQGDWRRKAKAGGYDRILVNGVTISERDKFTGATPGQLVQVTTDMAAQYALAAE